MQKRWVHESRKTLVCVDSYDSGVLQGRFYGACGELERFDSLTQFLVKMDAMLDESQAPQSYTSPRTFSGMLRMEDNGAVALGIRQGARATFEVQILFRQHTSWQGVVVWMEQKMEQSFRSVLELILLIDSALRDMERSEAV